MAIQSALTDYAKTAELVDHANICKYLTVSCQKPNYTWYNTRVHMLGQTRDVGITPDTPGHNTQVSHFPTGPSVHPHRRTFMANTALVKEAHERGRQIRMAERALEFVFRVADRNLRRVLFLRVFGAVFGARVNAVLGAVGSSIQRQ